MKEIDWQTDKTKLALYAFKTFDADEKLKKNQLEPLDKMMFNRMN